VPLVKQKQIQNLNQIQEQKIQCVGRAIFARHMAQESVTPIPALRHSAPGAFEHLSLL
jgi:hypothetical protein